MVKSHSKFDAIKAFLSRAKATLPGRRLWLLIGLGLLVYGQTLMHQREHFGEVNPNLELWNITLRLDIVNMQNFGTAIPYLLAGTIMCAFALLPLWNKDEEYQTKTYNKISANWSYILPRLVLGFILFAFLIFKLAKHEYTPALPWLWLITLALLTYLLFEHEKSTKNNLSPNISRVDIFWISGLFLLAQGIGSFALLDIPNIMVPDEGSFWETGRAIATGEFKPAFFGFGVYTFPIASSIFQGLVMRMTGINLWGWRFASVLAGTLTVIPLYLLAREWFDRRVAILSVFIMVSSPYYLSFARMGYNNSQALFPVVLSLYLWSLGFKRASNLYYWLAGLAAGLGFYTYTAAWLGLVVIIILMTLLTAMRHIRFRQALIATSVFLTATAATAGPRLIYGASSENAEPLFYKLIETSFINPFYGSAFYGPAELYPEGDVYLIGQSALFYAPQVYAELLTRSSIRTLAALFDPFLVTEHFMTTNFAGGFLAAMGLALGLGLSLRTIKQNRSILLLTWLGAGLFFLSIIAAFPPRHTHLVSIIPALALLSAVGWTATIDTLTYKLRQSRTQTGPFVLVCAILIYSGAKEYFVIMPERNPPLFEDIVSWLAWRTEEPLTIVYVGANEKTPHRVQYHVDTYMIPHRYISTLLQNFNWENAPENSIIFFEQHAEQLPNPPPRFRNEEKYKNANKEIIGYAWTDTDVNLNPAPPFPVTREEIPVTIIPAVLTLVIITFALLAVRVRVNTEKTIEHSGFKINMEVTLRKDKNQKEEDRPL